MLLVVLAVLLVSGFLVLRRSGGGGDLPATVVGAAVRRLPADRQDWGAAMVAELTQVRGRVRRWGFAVGVLRVVLFPPPRHGRRVLAVGGVGLAVAVAATVAAARTVPGLAVFVAVFGALLCGYAAVVAARVSRRRPAPARLVAAVVGLAGVAGATGTVVRVAAAHPAATRDGTHVFSVLLAVLLVGYVALAVTPPRLGAAVLWWPVAGALACGTVWLVGALTGPARSGGTNPFLAPAGAVAVLAVAIGVAFGTGSRRAGVRAGLLTAALAAPIHFTADLTALLRVRDLVPTDPYDVAAYPHSGYPDVASFLLSDAVAGGIITGLLLYPLALLAVALIGAALGGWRRPAVGVAVP
jgi:hypothetical protein